MTKQVFKVMVVATVLMVFAGTASAGGLGIIFDPFPSPPGGGPNVYDLLNQGPYTITWQSCTVPPLPTGSALLGDPACLAMLNDTGAPITALNLTFTVPSGFPLGPITCSNDPGDTFLATNNCASYSSLTVGEVVTLTFSGPMDVPPNFAIYIGETGATGMPDSNVTLPAHDPSTLVLLGVGMAMLAMSGIRRYA